MANCETNTTEEQYANKTTKDFKVGDILWRDSYGYIGNKRVKSLLRQCKVMKVGRKWVTVSHDLEKLDEHRWDRFDPSQVQYNTKTGFILDGGDWHSPGTVYLEKKHCEDLVEKFNRHEYLRRMYFDHHHPANLTLQQLRDICKILGVDDDSVQ